MAVRRCERASAIQWKKSLAKSGFWDARASIASAGISSSSESSMAFAEQVMDCCVRMADQAMSSPGPTLRMGTGPRPGTIIASSIRPDCTMNREDCRSAW